MATMRRERLSIDKLAPTHYILAISCKLTSAGKGELAPLIGPSLRSEKNTSRIYEDNSESSLSDRIDALKKLAIRFGVSDNVLNRAISEIEERIGDIEEQSSCECSPGYSSLKESEQDTFNDSALRDLFITLLDG